MADDARPMPSIDDHLRAASTLLRILAPDAKTPWWIAHRRYAVEEQRVTLELDGVGVEALELRPRGAEVGAVMLCHGMHHLGGREPRLLALANALAGAGLRVVVPHLPGLAAYRLDPRAVDEVLAASEATARRIGRADVGVVSISLGGGIALIAATDAARGRSIRFVLGIGAHDDLTRLGRWFAGGTLLDPGGRAVTQKPDPYGLQLLLHDAPELFFGPEADRAREALVPALHDLPSEALQLAEGLSPGARAIVRAAVLGEPDGALTSRVLAMLETRRAELEALSPSVRLGTRRLPVFLLHGRDDRLIPSSESQQLAARLGPRAELLLTPALGHADRTTAVGPRDAFALVHFVARVFQSAR